MKRVPFWSKSGIYGNRVLLVKVWDLGAEHPCTKHMHLAKLYKSAGSFLFELGCRQCSTIWGGPNLQRIPCQ